VRSQFSRRAVLAVAAAVLLSGVAACGDDGGDESTETAGRPTTTAASVGGGEEGDDSFDAVVEAAGEEGTVTIYSSQPLDPLNAFAARFEEEYADIDVEVVRGTDGELAARVQTEHESGTQIADVWVTTSQGDIEPMEQEGGWFTAPEGPNFEAEDYLPSYMHGSYFEVGAAILTFGWNTDDVPDGLDDYDDLLDPALAGGRIGTIDANCCSAAVDFYLYLEERFGESFTEDLAAQQPRIYPSALPIGEALGSGEIQAAAFTLPLTEMKAVGAPVDFALADQVWGTRFFGGILEGSPHPNAAQVLIDFMISTEGQEVINAGISAVREDVPGVLTTNDMVREQDLAALSPDRVAAYQERWNGLFRR
jgi:iron(III) transport system substrate-binding protein